MIAKKPTPPEDASVKAIVAVLPQLATKEDVAKLETKIVEFKHDLVKWTIGTIAVATTILGLLITLTD